jgi:putative ABC transport system substrate-binding protein
MRKSIARRDFITLLGGAAAAWPLAARAQRSAMPLVGVVAHLPADPTNAFGRVQFRKGLGESGYVEGRNVSVEYHFLENQYDRAPAVMADLVRRRVAVIVPYGFTWRAAKDATSTIPIVFRIANDPVKMRLVASLARPGGNATGVTNFAGEINGKRLGLLHDLLPKAVRVAVLVDPDQGPEVQEAVRGGVTDVQEAARSLGLQIQIFNAATKGEIDTVFAALARDRPDALFVYGPSAFFNDHRAALLTLEAAHRIPASYNTLQFVREGGLMSYDADASDLDRVSGAYVGRILKGAKPADLPVVRPTKFRFSINLKTARALGIEVPPQLLAITDRVIE